MLLSHLRLINCDNKAKFITKHERFTGYDHAGSICKMAKSGNLSQHLLLTATVRILEADILIP